MSKALAPAPVIASAALADDDLDNLVAGIAESLGVGELAAPLDVCANCDHMANQHAGACEVVGCDCQAFEAVAAADDEAAVELDAVEYAGAPGRFEVVGFQIAEPNLTSRLDAAVRFLVGGQADAAPIVRLRLEELALRSFAEGVTPPPDGGIGVGSLEWEAVLAPEGRLTDDGRAFAPGSIKWRELPLSLMAMIKTADGHDGAKLCGRIDVIWRDEASGLIRAAGVFDDGEYGLEIARLVADGKLRGNSVDLAIHDYEYGPRSQWFDDDGNWAPTEAAAQDDADIVDALFDTPTDEPVIYVVTDAVIGMSTVCPFPAFADAVIEIGRSLAAAGSPAVWTIQSDAGFRVTPQRRVADRLAGRSEDGILALLASALERTGVLTGLERDRIADAGHAIDGRTLVASAAVVVPSAEGAAGAVGTGPNAGVGSWFGPSSDATAITAVELATSGGAPAALTAAVTPPISPPAAWFANPELDQPTPIVVTDDGRLYGHAAAWGSCHTGFPDVCVTPPHSVTDYRFFHLKSCECDDASLVDVGTITLEAPHANQRLGLVDASAHYDNTGMAAADVVVGEDEHGIWVAGAVRPHLTTEMIRELRGAVLSGDWRNYEGNLELIGLLAVNVPGFPIPKVRARVAGGAMQSLVAAGVIGAELETEPLDDVLAAIDADELAVATAQLAALTDEGVHEQERELADATLELAELARDEG